MTSIAATLMGALAPAVNPTGGGVPSGGDTPTGEGQFLAAIEATLAGLVAPTMPAESEGDGPEVSVVVEGEDQGEDIVHTEVSAQEVVVTGAPAALAASTMPAVRATTPAAPPTQEAPQPLKGEQKPQTRGVAGVPVSTAPAASEQPATPVVVRSEQVTSAPAPAPLEGYQGDEGDPAPAQTHTSSVSQPAPAPAQNLGGQVSTAGMAPVAAPASVPAPTAPAPVTPATAPSAPDPAPNLAAQLAPRITALREAGPGQHVLTVRVDPESFGPVRLVAHISEGAMRIDIVGGTEQAREALRAAMPDLRRDLAGAGLSADLNLSEGTDARGDGQAFTERNAPTVAGGRGLSEPGGERPAASVRSTHDGVLDVMI